MSDRLLFDTDVLVDYLRGQRDATSYMEALTDRLFISAITAAELYAGVREGDERQALDTFVTVFEWLPVNEEIARIGGLLRRDFRKSHNVGLADALIAATAQSCRATLVTLNRKHYPMLSSVLVPSTKS